MKKKNNSFFFLELNEEYIEKDDYKTLIQTSCIYEGKIENKPSLFLFPNFLSFLLTKNKNPVISDEEVSDRLYGVKNVKEENILSFYDKENNINTPITDKYSQNKTPIQDDDDNLATNEFSHFLKSPDFLYKSYTDPNYKIDIKNMDDRTTCMIKNIPNKYTQKMLINLLNEHHFGCFDFVYLRMDFKNKCNVGYAFVNFTDTEHIVTFYKKINNKGWKLFSSSKIAELAYASIQGVDNLVNKFKHSLVMKEQESYRPKTFYTDGYLKGTERPML